MQNAVDPSFMKEFVPDFMKKSLHNILALLKRAQYCIYMHLWVKADRVARVLSISVGSVASPKVFNKQYSAMNTSETRIY